MKIILQKIEVKAVAFEITQRAEFRQFKLVQYDTAPVVQIQFLDDIEDPIDLTGYQIDFFFKKVDGSEILNLGHTDCTIVSASQGIAQYRWAVGDIRYPGIHLGSFQVISDSGAKQSIPDAVRFDVREQLDGVSGV